MLWTKGITSWDALDLFETEQLRLFGPPAVSRTLASRHALDAGDSDFFAKRLERQEYYRIALTFPAETIFLDIETTGLSLYYDFITLVGWSKQTEYNVFIRGGSTEQLEEALSTAKAIVTFNGSIFDLPFLRKEFPNIRIPRAHVDLRFLAKRVGLRGGQKIVEQAIGVERRGALKDLDGHVAPLLWHRYRRGDTHALKLLISYNHADIEGLKDILDESVARLLKQQDAPQAIRVNRRFSRQRSRVRLLNGGGQTEGRIRITPYLGDSEPSLQVKDLRLRAPMRIVGIDLTGSEERASGWCVLDGDTAVTRTVKTDEEIIAETLRVSPLLASIDSPLSLPCGRIIVTDDDPGRSEYGITRQCERILKKRGINVYPSLIRSMQALTARGIKLADSLRKAGVAVIESYPGAAQDIMRIPRKRADLALLKSGLSEFGIRGEYVSAVVTHDELDAITSAVVGLFFMSGRFEALGNDEESYLIVPDIRQETIGWPDRTVVGFSGPISAGKTTAARALERKGYTYGRFSLVLEGILRERNLETTRENLQQLGEEINKSPGQRWLCDQLVRRLPTEGNIVIDGLRHPEDHAFMVERFGPNFVHIYIEAPEQVRRLRYIAEGRAEMEFCSAERHPVEQNVAKLATLAEKAVKNLSTKEDFEKVVSNTVSLSAFRARTGKTCP